MKNKKTYQIGEVLEIQKTIIKITNIKISKDGRRIVKYFYRILKEIEYMNPLHFFEEGSIVYDRVKRIPKLKAELYK